MLTVKSCEKSKIIVMFIIIISILTSCGNKVETLEDFDAEEELEPVKLTFYLIGNEPADKDEVLKEIENKCGLNVKLDFQWFGDNYFNKVNTALASNEKLDAFVCGMPISNYNIFEMFRSGQVKDITNLLPQYAPTLYRQLSETELNLSKVNGKIILVPPLINSAEGLGVYVDKKYVDKYNINSIDTFEDYGEVLNLIKENEKDIIPGTICDGNFIKYMVYAYGYVFLDENLGIGYKWDDPKMEVVPFEQVDEFKSTVELINDWYKNGYVAGYNPNDKFASKLRLTLNNIKEELTTTHTIKEYYYILYKDRKIQRNSAFGQSYYSSIAFNNNSKNVERALMFLNWIQSSQENYDLFNYGIEGIHYTLQDEKINFINRYLNDGVTIPFTNFKYHRVQEKDGYSADFMEEYLTYIDEKTEYAPHQGFYLDYTSIEKELVNRQKSFNLYISSKVMQGTYDISKTDEIIDKLRKTGTDKIVAEVQKQLDNWRKNNK